MPPRSWVLRFEVTGIAKALSRKEATEARDRLMPLLEQAIKNLPGFQLVGITGERVGAV